MAANIGGVDQRSLATGLGSGDEVQKVFERIDTNGDGKISAAELGGVMRALGTEVGSGEVEMMIAEMDSDGDGFVDLDDFKEFNGAGGGGRQSSDRTAAIAGGDDATALRDAFEMYDADGNGKISAQELHRVLQQLGDKCSVDDCHRMIGSVDANGDGSVDFEEFKRMMTNNKSGTGENRQL